MGEVSEATKQKIAETFTESNLLRFGKFTIKSGLVTPFYIDLRKAQSHPEAFHAIIDAYSEMLADSNPSSLLAGIPEAATPFAAVVGYKLERILIQPRKVVKEHGTKSSVEGDFNEGDRVILLDDLITKGDSKLEAIKQVEAAGLIVDKLVILIDREQGGCELIRDAGYTIESVFTVSELMGQLLDLGKIDQKQFDEAIAFVRNN